MPSYLINTLNIELAQRLASKNTSNFDHSSVTAFVEKDKNSEAKLVFPDITVRQTRQLIEAIPSGKATGADGLSARLLKIAAPTIAHKGDQHMHLQGHISNGVEGGKSYATP